MEEIRFKTDHSQHGDDKNLTARLRIYAPKIILFVLSFTLPFQYTSLLHIGNIEVSKGPTTFL